ncbi:MAG: hypothetical protein NZO16_00295 [Deltaproteobacteria bacterium]|nr:hypothetical protein [Deltaproteobacteria bacterium]
MDGTPVIEREYQTSIQMSKAEDYLKGKSVNNYRDKRLPREKSQPVVVSVPNVQVTTNGEVIDGVALAKITIEKDGVIRIKLLDNKGDVMYYGETTVDALANKLGLQQSQRDAIKSRNIQQVFKLMSDRGIPVMLKDSNQVAFNVEIRATSSIEGTFAHHMGLSLSRWSFFLRSLDGVNIDKVHPNGTLSELGFQEGDVIVGAIIKYPSDASAKVYRIKNLNDLMLVMNQAANQNLDIKLIIKPGDVDLEEIFKSGNNLTVDYAEKGKIITIPAKTLRDSLKLNK